MALFWKPFQLILPVLLLILAPDGGRGMRHNLLVAGLWLEWRLRCARSSK